MVRHHLDTACLVGGEGLVAAGAATGTVYVSEDDGESWEVAAAGLPPVRCLALGATPTR